MKQIKSRKKINLSILFIIYGCLSMCIFAEPHTFKEGKAYLTTDYVKEGEVILVPIRPIVEYMGAKLEYTPQTKGIKVSNGEYDMEFWMGEDDLIIDEQKIRFNASPTLKNGTTMVEVDLVGMYWNIDIMYDEQADKIKYIPRKEPFDVVTLQDGSQYKGEMKDGKPHGFGHLKMKDGSVCNGYFNNGQPDQYMKWYSGDKTYFYTGQVKNGKPHGYGLEYGKLYYEGQFKNGKKDGIGIGTDGTGFYKDDKLSNKVFDNIWSSENGEDYIFSLGTPSPLYIEGIVDMINPTDLNVENPGRIYLIGKMVIADGYGGKERQILEGFYRNMPNSVPDRVGAGPYLVCGEWENGEIKEGVVNRNTANFIGEYKDGTIYNGMIEYSKNRVEFVIAKK